MERDESGHSLRICGIFLPNVNFNLSNITGRMRLTIVGDFVKLARIISHLWLHAPGLDSVLPALFPQPDKA